MTQCFKRFFNYCNKKQLSGHFCYVAPLKPSRLTDRFIYVFLTRSAHRTLKSMMGLLSIFGTSYELSRCVPGVKRWMTWVLTVNSVVTVPTCFGWKTPQVILLIISGNLDHSRIRLMTFHKLSCIRRIVSTAKFSGTEMDTPIDNGLYQNSQYDCLEFALFGFS